MRRPLAWLLALAALPGALCAQQRTAWRIGTFDQSSREFHDSFGVDYPSRSSDVEFTVGKSTLLDWLRFQPGPANGLAGGRPHPFRIRFTLQDVPRGLYTLKLGVLYETPRLSQLRVEVNGHSGLFSFAPTLDYTAGDWEGTFVPQTSSAQRSIEIPASWLRTGENSVVLTAVDNPDTPQNSLGDIAPGESGIVYDALALEQNPTGEYVAGKVVLTAVPTVLYKQAGGGLREVVQTCVEANAGGTLPGDIRWTSKGFAETRRLNFETATFGERCASFEVPEWQGTLAAQLYAGGQLFPVELEAQKKWNVLIVPQEHLDIGFTDYREKVAELQSQSVDDVLDLLPDHPEFRWTLDGSWVATQYLAGRSEERIQKLIEAVRSGEIVVPPQYANQHTGVASLEGLARSLYPSHALARQFNIPLGAVNITDVPSYSWSYASILHSAGVKYFAAASNSWHAPIMLQGRWNEKSPFYWEGPDGGRVLMWYSRAYLQLASMFGTPPALDAVKDALPVFLQAYKRAGYRSNSVILYGSQLENTSLDHGQVTFPEEWAKQYAYPRLQFSTFAEAMSSIEGDFHGTIPTYRGDFGPYWEDGFTSDARSTAAHRANQQRLINAEVMGTIPSLLRPDLRPDPSLLRDAWNDSLLFDEHTWTSVAATTQPEGDQNMRQSASKRAYVTRADEDIAYSIERSFAQLEPFVAPKVQSLMVFNSLAWPRNGWLETDLPEGKRLVDPITGQAVPQEVLRTEAGTPLPGFGGPTHRVRYLAEGVPAVGYKLLSIADAGAEKPDVRTSSKAGNLLENRFYRVTLDAATGSIRSIWDKELKRELVDTRDPYRFAQYVYVSGADDMPNNSLYRYGAGLPMADLAPHPASGGRIVNISRGAIGERATLESSALNTARIRTEITLPTNEKRIDIEISLEKTPTLHREAVYIAFPLAMDQPQFAYDTQNGWVDPARDELEGGSREWYATQHWAAIHNDSWTGAIIPVDAPMIAFGDLVRGAWPTEFKPGHATIFTWLMSNYWSTNFMSSQGGSYTFRYTFVSSAKFEPAQLTRTGWERMRPLESDPVAASVTPSSDFSASFMVVDNPDVVLSTWKRAEDGLGSIVRLTEIAGRSEGVHINTRHMHLQRVQRCSLVEDCAGDVAVHEDGFALDMKPFEILTLRLETRPEK